MCVPPTNSPGKPGNLCANDSASKKKSVKVTIDGFEYDVTKWAHKHPGGKVIHQFNGKDATDVFHSFHSKEIATRWLKLFPKSKATVCDDTLETKDFRALKKAAEEEGLFNYSKSFYIWKLTSLITLFILSAAISVVYPHSLFACILSGALIGACMSQAGWLAHDVCHNQLFRNRRINDGLGYFVGNVLQGFAISWWKDKHNTHHAVCNIHGADPDIDTAPLAAWSKLDLPVLKSLSKVWQWWVAHQSLLFMPLMAFAQMSWRIQSLFFVFSEDCLRAQNVERVALSLHYVWYGWLVAAAAVNGSYINAMGLMFAIEAFGGWFKAFPFVVNHSGMPILPNGVEMSNLRLQATTSRDITPSPVTDFLMGGLNYQIEHHLFPAMPRHNLCQVKSRVAAICKKHGIPYQNMSFAQGITEVFQTLDSISELLHRAMEP